MHNRIKRSLTALAVSLLMAAAGVVGLASPALAVTTRWYAGGAQTFASAPQPTSILANVTVHNPTLDTTAPGIEGHTLGELEIEKTIGGQRQIVEVGYRHPAGAADSHLFVGAWVNNVFQGYSGGFVEYNGAPNVWHSDDVLTPGTTMKLGIQYDSTTPAGGGWWVISNVNGATGEWLGYFPSTLWTGAGVSGFTVGDKVQAFGEVANTSLPLGCTDMGDGNFASAGPPAVGALISSITLGGIATGSVNIAAVNTTTDATKYNIAFLGTAGNIRSFRYGGPGAC